MPLPMPKPDQRIITTMPYAGLRGMQVCVMEDVPDSEILAFANSDNPVSGGWHTVIRSAEHAREVGVDEAAAPGDCVECPGRKHKIVICM